ncbi:MAG: cell division protein FtsL [Thermanaeromonas sp.]|uniref:septum formation initiator family protein n=1 Tax=Thermanaeromonas sp. TaxID=2003697 RepID=UPI002438E0D5|nr:cell division protein FtsL [Thermanaeromonas sp.]MCG0276993.1 cell division protein FtsL [Thermanaeromonas sp.]
MLAAPQVKLSWPQQPLVQPYPQRSKARGKPKAMAVVLVLLAFAIGLTWTVQCVFLTLKGYELTRIKREILALQQANEQLELEVARLKSPERVAELATTKLGMVKPAPQDVRLSTSTWDDDPKVAENSPATQYSQETKMHSFWLRVGQALQQWLAGARPAEAADS